MRCLPPRPNNPRAHRAESTPTRPITPGPACLPGPRHTTPPRDPPSPASLHHTVLAVPGPTRHRAVRPCPSERACVCGRERAGTRRNHSTGPPSRPCYLCEGTTSKSQPQTDSAHPSFSRASRFHLSSSRVHGDHRRGAAARPAGHHRRRGAEETAVVVGGGGGEKRGLRDRRPRRRTVIQGAGGGVAAGGRVPEEHVPAVGVGVDVREGEGSRRRGEGSCRFEKRGRRSWRRAVREGEHGRGAVPAQGGPADVRRVRGAQDRARRALRLLLFAGRRRPVRRRVRGQGRGPHARRGRAMGHVHRFLQEAEDHERLRSTMMTRT